MSDLSNTMQSIIDEENYKTVDGVYWSFKDFSNRNVQKLLEEYQSLESQLKAVTEENEKLKMTDCRECFEVCYPKLDSLERERDALRLRVERLEEAFKWIVSQENLMFMECTQAEELIARAKAALGEK